MKQSALGALYPIQLTAFSFSRQLTRVVRSAETLFFYFFNCSLYFSSAFADDIFEPMSCVHQGPFNYAIN